MSKTAKKRVLLLTDSRGIHKPAGSNHKLYAERLAEMPDIELTAFRCPFQWTTIPDLLDLINAKGAENFEHVILHAGIVDHSPRTHSGMMDNLIDPKQGVSQEEARELVFSGAFAKKKIVNRKRRMLEEVFGKEALASHLTRPFEQAYEGEATINLYTIEMMQQSLLPRLREIPNLIFISSNNFVPGWQGDYPKPRPENISIIEDYSRVLCEQLPSVVNLHQWLPKHVQKFTCDNLHLTKEGSDWIYLRLLEEMGLRERDYMANRSVTFPPARPVFWPLAADAPADMLDSVKMAQQEPLGKKEIMACLDEAGVKNGPLATLVIGFRFQEADEYRYNNMKCLVDYMNRTYPDLFDILLLEQAEEPSERFDLSDFPGCRYEFLYNPEAFNRGWGYNAACLHFTDSRVVGFFDTDVIPGKNFLRTVLDCYEEFDAVSPNRNLFYATAEQTAEFRRKGRFDQFSVAEETLKNPTTLAGGMLVVNREAFLGIGGFEQYVGYGCEDRVLDVTMLTLLPSERVRMDSYAYFHQYHPVQEGERKYFASIYNHMARHYGCEYVPGLGPLDYIHANCRHADEARVRTEMERRRPHIGQLDLYRRHSYLTVNGFPGNLNWGVELIRSERPEPVFPPEFDGVKPYNDSEELTGRFANAWAPAVNRAEAVDDTRQLQHFYNRYKGKRCFIIGNGPSLNEHDLSLMDGEYSFAVNSFYYKTRESGFRPTFFVVEDSSVIKENQQEIVDFEAPFKFFPSIYQSLHPKKPGTYFFNLNRGFYDKFSPNYAIPRFSTDISKVAYCGQSVTYINLQLAYYMGFTEVYLIGMDFNYIIPKTHKREGDVLTSDTDDPNHFHKDYFGKGKTWKDPKLDRVLMNYKMAGLVYECAGRKIYNATKGGHLEEFERVDYDGLFGSFNPQLRKEPLDLERPDESWSKPKYPEALAASVPGMPAPARAMMPELSTPSAETVLYLPGEGGQQRRVDFKALPKEVRQAVMLYEDPVRRVAQAIMAGKDAERAAEDWAARTEKQMRLFRANRDRIVLLPFESWARDQAGCVALLTGRKIPIRGLEAVKLPKLDAELAVLAADIVAGIPAAAHLERELRASSLILATAGKENVSSVSTAAAEFRARLAELTALRNQKQLLEEQLIQLRGSAETFSKELDKAQQEIQELRDHTEAMLQSTSWRVTAPLRSLKLSVSKGK